MAAPIIRMEPSNQKEPFAWIVDYRAALCEADEKLLPALVIKARESIVQRRVSLHKGRSDDGEIRALEIALKTLRALHSNWI